MKIISCIKNTPKKYLLIGISLLLVIAVVIIIFRDGRIKDSDVDGYKNYSSKKLNLSFDFPEDYKVFIKEDVIYISMDKDITVPYFEIRIDNNSKNPNEYLNNSTKTSKKELGYTFTPITEVSSSAIGDKYVSKITYNYVKDDTLIVENRYAFKYNNKIYVISSHEEKNNNDGFNGIINNIISSIK